MADERPWITCHVLDTAKGKPAAGIRVTLELLSFQRDEHSGGFAAIFEGRTNADGRVESWSLFKDQVKKPGTLDFSQLVDWLKSHGFDTARWSIDFETRAYNKTSFFDNVTVNFTTQTDEAHYHVPLLLSPYSYTTYRGS